MREPAPTQDPEQCQGVTGIMGGCIVKMYELVTIHHSMSTPPGVCSIKSPEYALEYGLVHGQWSLDKF